MSLRAGNDLTKWIHNKQAIKKRYSVIFCFVKSALYLVFSAKFV